MSEKERLFCGNARKIEFKNGGSIMKITLCLDQIEEHFPAHGFTSNSGRRYLTVEAVRKKNVGPDEKNTHFVAVDTWKPDSNRSAQPQFGNSQEPDPYIAQSNPFGEEVFDDDIPF